MPDPTDSKYTYFVRNSGLHASEFEDYGASKFWRIMSLVLGLTIVGILFYTIWICYR